jgi:OFA family oxalate/formate antiporter-like MFS transporter
MAGAAAPSRGPIAGAAVLTHVCLGSVYAWSVAVPALQRQTGWTRPQLTWAFSFAIAALGLTAALAAGPVRRWGPRAAVRLSALLFGLGGVLAGLAVHIHALPLLYLGYGLVGGVGLGLGYVPPVTTLMAWFADRKGLATGLAVGGFGIGALVASYAYEWLLHRVSCAAAFMILGVAYGLLILAAASRLRLPAAAGAAQGNAPAPAAALGQPRFWLLWTVFFLNIGTGILLIALARPMLEEAAGPGRGAALPAVTAVAVMGLCNGLGRLGWSSLSDRLGRTTTWTVMFAIQGLAFLAVRGNGSPLALAAGLWLIASCYGGGFAICPALVADSFGPAQGPGVYGLALTAWGAAALVSPPLAALLRESLGSYTAILGACALASGVGLALVRALARTAGPVPAGAAAEVRS